MTGSVENTESRIAFDDVDLSTTLAETVRYDSITGELFDPETALPVDAQATSISFSGGLTVSNKINDMSFSGLAEVEMVALSLSGSDNNISLREISLNGTFSGNGSSFAADIGFVVNNAATFNTIGALNYDGELWVQEWETGDIFNAQEEAASLGITTLLNAYYPTWSGEGGV